MQLLRFVYDPATLRKRKLQDCVQIPETIDLREYVSQRLSAPPSDSSASSSATASAAAAAADDNFIYDLVAILRHQGTSAYHGHYVAEARNEHNVWWNFNDEKVQKLDACPASRREDDGGDKSAATAQDAIEIDDDADEQPSKVDDAPAPTVADSSAETDPMDQVSSKKLKPSKHRKKVNTEEDDIARAMEESLQIAAASASIGGGKATQPALSESTTQPAATSSDSCSATAPDEIKVDMSSNNSSNSSTGTSSGATGGSSSRKRGRPAAQIDASAEDAEAKNSSGSRNAYMLMYVRRAKQSGGDSFATSSMPQTLSASTAERVRQSDLKFQQEREAFKAHTVRIEEFVKKRKEAIARLLKAKKFQLSEVDADDARPLQPFFLVSTEFLKQWICGEPANAKSAPVASVKAEEEDESMKQAIANSVASFSSAQVMGSNTNEVIELDTDEALSSSSSSSSASATLSSSSSSLPSTFTSNQPPVVQLQLPFPPTDITDMNKSIMCRHNKADPRKYHLMKRITPEFWTEIKAEYTFDIELNDSSLCHDCAAELTQAGQARVAELNKLNALVDAYDAQLEQAKTAGDFDPTFDFFISKQFVKEWKAAIKKATDKQAAPDFSSLNAEINADVRCPCAPVKSSRVGLSQMKDTVLMICKLQPSTFKKCERIASELWSKIRDCHPQFADANKCPISFDCDAVGAKPGSVANDSDVDSQDEDPVSVEQLIECQICWSKKNSNADNTQQLKREGDEEKKKVKLNSSAMQWCFPLKEVKLDQYCMLPNAWFQSAFFAACSFVCSFVSFLHSFIFTLCWCSHAPRVGQSRPARQ